MLFHADGRVGEVTVEVTPIRKQDRRAYLVLFEPPPPATEAGSGEPAPAIAVGEAMADRDRQIARLSQEVQQARARLISLVDEHEASDEDHQQTTEDALSANEELQSLTEELETAKEELQSTNEELVTVNRELEIRNLALVAAHDVARAVVETVGVPLLVLDTDLIVRHVTASFASAF